jgi:hypothetical protein
VLPMWVLHRDRYCLLFSHRFFSEAPRTSPPAFLRLRGEPEGQTASSG